MNPNPNARRPIRPLDSHQFRPQRRVFDISAPNKMPPPATSRPVITGHNAPVRDQSITPHRTMMPQQPAPVPPKPVNGMEFTAKPAVAAPIRRVAAPLAPAPPPASVRPLAPQSPVAPPRPVAPQPVAQIQPARAQPYPSPTRGVVGTPPQQIGSDDDVFSNAMPAPERIDDEPVLISKHVPHDQTTKWRWIIAGSLLFLFLLIVFDILLDADFITLRQVPHTHFF